MIKKILFMKKIFMNQQWINISDMMDLKVKSD